MSIQIQKQTTISCDGIATAASGKRHGCYEILESQDHDANTAEMLKEASWVTVEELEFCKNCKLNLGDELLDLATSMLIEHCKG